MEQSEFGEIFFILMLLFIYIGKYCILHSLYYSLAGQSNKVNQRRRKSHDLWSGAWTAEYNNDRQVASFIFY
jgi:hypothetical protein